MFPSFSINGKNFYVVEISKSSIHPKSVVLDPVFYNFNRNKLSERFQLPPARSISSCRSAFNRIKFQDMFPFKEVNFAIGYLEGIVDQYAGVLIPNADHRWQEQIHKWHSEGKLVYYTNEHQVSKIFLVQTW